MRFMEKLELWAMVFLILIVFTAAVIIGRKRNKMRENDVNHCLTIGYTKIEYGVGVTNCGDTIRIDEYSEKGKEWRKQNKK